MKLYRVTGEVTISVTVLVEARDEAHAREIAGSAGMQQFCHSCSEENDPDDPEWRTSELDGEAKILTVELDEDDEG